MKILLGWAALSLFVSLGALGQSARADDSCNCSEKERNHHRLRRFAVSLSPQYYSLNTDGYASAFSSNGLSAPKAGMVGFAMTIYGTTETDWQLGLALASVATGNDSGSNTAAYDQDVLGVWTGHAFELSDDFELSLGAILAWGHARVEVLSQTGNGRTTEDAFLAQPRVVLSYRIARRVRLGVSATYSEPMGQTDSVKGQGLTTGNITYHGFNAGIEFIIGRFGGERDEAADQGKQKPVSL